jgi:hypothetical protein
MPEGTKMSNGTPAHSVGAVDARWLFPQERAPSSPPQKMRLDDCEALWASTFADIGAVVAKVNATLAEVDAKLEALRARPAHFCTLGH